jgi:hypothetical protein
MSKYSTGNIIYFKDVTADSKAIPVTGVPSYLSQFSPFTLRINLPQYSSLLPAGQAAESALKGVAAANLEVRTKAHTLAEQKKKAADLIPALRTKYINQLRNPTVPQDPLNDPMTLLDIAYQKAQIAANPEVTFLINPNSFSVTHSKIQNHDQLTRYGAIFQSMLGDTYIQIQCNGRIGAYTVFKPPDKDGFSADGTGYFAKINSKNYLNFLDILNVFLNNGAIFDTYGKSRANLLVGSVSIIYDGWEYIGSFDSFSYNYSETAQNGGLDWDFSFQATSMFPVDNS